MKSLRFLVIAVMNLGQKFSTLPHPSQASMQPTNKTYNIAALLWLFRDGNIEELICSTRCCRASRRCK